MPTTKNEAPVIESGIPIPPLNKNPRSGVYVNTLRQMKPGDSIALTKKQCAYVTEAAKRIKLKVTTRRIGDDEFRLWMLGIEEQKEGSGPYESHSPSAATAQRSQP